MKLVVFDIDGTLTQTNEVDGECFVRAFVDELGVSSFRTDWATYQHCTDSGITNEIFMDVLGRFPSKSEVERVQGRFLELLDKACSLNGDGFRATPGASEVLAALTKDSPWLAVMATGGWGASARFKLDKAGLKVETPLVSADMAVSREEIVTEAITAAERFYRQSSFDRVVLVGDAVWDLRTTQSLDLPFVGVALGSPAKRLKELGASHVIPDFTSLELFFRAVSQAVVPKPLGQR